MCICVLDLLGKKDLEHQVPTWLASAILGEIIQDAVHYYLPRLQVNIADLKNASIQPASLSLKSEEQPEPQPRQSMPWFPYSVASL
jgi:hypothetical protein